jgi:hypothetical protein
VTQTINWEIDKKEKKKLQRQAKISDRPGGTERESNCRGAIISIWNSPYDDQSVEIATPGWAPFDILKDNRQEGKTERRINL